jgi:mycofactocin system FadH/OYE family oxidoreductase 1
LTRGDPYFRESGPARQHDVVTYEALLRPWTIGEVTARNRVVFGPHETNLGRRRAISDRHVAYYRRRALGGAGVVVTEEASVHPSDWPLERAPLAADSAEGWAAVASACHDEGALVLAAIGHAGGQGTAHWSQRELWGPSPVPEVNTREVPKVMEPEDIADVVAGFAAAAKLAVDAGCDGIEVNAGQYSLVRQFLSGLTNTRDDEWGGERTRFADAVLAAVRSAVGPQAIVALRLSCDELAPWAGITPETGAELAARFAADEGDRRIDLITVVRGSIYSAGATRPDGHTPPGFNMDLSRSVRSAVRAVAGDRVMVVGQGSIVDVGQATWALDDGAADAVEMTRAQIADPLLVSKLVAGESERIRPCTLCNQMCAVRDNRNPIVSCIAEPFSGHETEDPPVAGSTLQPVDVLVVGGGPAGLEAARVAARRGHRVRLAERSEELGGALRTVARMPGRERFALLADWLESECRHDGVELRTGHEVDAAELAHAPHAIVATGALYGDLSAEVELADGAVVRTAAAALDAPDTLPPGSVLVRDPIGGPIGVAVAEVLAADGRSVHLVTGDFIVGNELARSGDLGDANARLARAGVTMHRRAVLRSVGAGVAVIEDRFGGGRSELAVDVVVDAGHRLPASALGDDLAARTGRSSRSAGDAVAPRTVHEAVLEGRRAALDLG